MVKIARLEELFDNPYVFDWTSSDDRFIADFRTDSGVRYNASLYPVVSIEGDAPFLWGSFEFSLVGRTGKHQYDLTGTGDQYRVFSTVAKVMGQAIREVMPTVMVFTAKEKSRVKLYRAMAERISSKSGYKNVSQKEFVSIIESIAQKVSQEDRKEVLMMLDAHRNEVRRGSEGFHFVDEVGVREFLSSK